MIVAGDRVGVAVSGGADSIALLRILDEIREKLAIRLSIVHFDHQLRGEESERDAQFVSDLAQALNLDIVIERRDVAAEAKRNRWNLEDAARRLRYAFFERVLDDGHVSRIAVAHTADDQAETVLSHLIRGTGPTGLAAIYPLAGTNSGTIVRPLLPFRRNDLRAYLRGIAQTWCEDSTNRDPRRMRARIRSQLLPVLERDFSRSIVDRLCELARLSREEETFWSTFVEERYRALARTGAQGASIRVADLLDPVWRGEKAPPSKKTTERFVFNAASRPLTERLIRRLYEEVRGSCHGLGANHVEQVIRLATRSSSGTSVELPGGIVAERVFDDLHFSAKETASSARAKSETVSARIAYQYMVALPGHVASQTTISVPEAGSRFCLKLIDWADSERETTDDSQTFDADSLRAPLILRNWRPGDAYTPCGGRQPRKLKQMLLAARVPARDRREWPVLESAGAVIWARGMPVSSAVRTRETTRVAVRIAEERL